MILPHAQAPPEVRAQDPFETQPSIELPAELDRVLRDYERAWSAGEEDVLASLFTEDGYVPSRAGWIKGHSAIRQRYEGASGDLRLRAINFSIEGQVGYIIGAYGYGESAEEADRGNFVLALRKAPDGRWLIVADLDRTNQ